MNEAITGQQFEELEEKLPLRDGDLYCSQRESENAIEQLILVSGEGDCVGSFQLRSLNSYDGDWLRESDVYDYNRDGLMDFLVYNENGYILFLNTGDGLRKFSGTREEFQSMNNRILLLNYSFISQG